MTNSPNSPNSRTGTGSPLTTGLAIASFLSLGITVALGLTLPATVEQGEYSRLIAIHPGLAWASYTAFGVSALASAAWLWPRTQDRRWDLLAGASMELAVLFTALTLVTGSIWGRPTWGVWWTWDARLTLSALMLMLELGYLALREVPADVRVIANRCAITALLSVVVIPINHFAVEWWRTLHQGRSLLQLNPQRELDGEFIGAMLVGFLAMTLVYGWMLVHRFRVARLESLEDELVLQRALHERRTEEVSV